MPQVINTNIPSLTAQRNLNASQNDVATSLQRLSSGLRINGARDDAAGLAISERFTAQIRGINQAARNANDGISLAQTAEGDLGQVANNLQRIRELSVQSANATNSATDRAALQAEVDQLTAEINRVAEQSNFNGVSLLDGSFSAQTFQVGANAGQSITVDGIVDSRTASLGNYSLQTDGTAVDSVTTAAAALGATGVTAETDLTVTTDAGTSAPISYAINSSAADIASAIQTAAGGLGVTATAENSATLGSLSAAGTVALDLNGSSISTTIADVNDLTNLVDAINGVAGSTGVTATFTSDSSNGSITLSTTDGRNIAIEDFTNGTATIDFSGETLTSGGADSATRTGTVTLESTQGALSVGSSNADAFGATNASFSSVAGIDITTAAGSTAALDVIDAALSQVNSGRADLGAIQNRFESVVASLQTSSENLSAARSRIQDADFAAETAALTRGQILQQAGISVLSQANAQPQNVLALLQ